MSKSNIFEPGKEFETQAAIDIDRRWLQHTNPGMGALSAHLQASQRVAEPPEGSRGRKGFFARLFG